ncbi:DUF4307 domain-containing protein [Pengzhenrongella frigida]|uniref:DUF4307 domain-containing protein n=1 Tax=Pengzhenrongella frigida TaxID=1259133 RepID=A0A4Q5MXY3_9MICO|nr:DUF4307 domain-containing protein [Cellulomonas sp. HLT2-17]RYV50500.1 DUF4307 domain-containing protein [Cellulomonas sp. HLT2-17]
MSESTTQHLPARRYGPEPTARRKRSIVVGLAVGGAVATALGIWIGIGVLQDPVQWKDVGFSVEGPERIDVTFDVIKDPAATAECTVHALNQGFAEVGLARVTVGPGTTRIHRETVPVATQELAVTGLVETCAIVADAD